MKKRRRDDPKEDTRKHVSLMLPPEWARRLETIRGWLRTDPNFIGPHCGNQTAVLYAIDRCIKNPPAHVGGEK